VKTAVVRKETGKLLHLALPLMGAQLAQMGMGVTDAVMAGQYSSVDLAGIALGGSVLWPITMTIMGVVQAVTPNVAQLNGAGKYSEIGELIRQGLWMALFGSLVAVLLLQNMAPVYRFMEVDPQVTAISLPYLQYCSFGIPALMCFFCLRFLADGLGFTRIALMIAVIALILKVPLNYVLIYGKFGLPEMGGAGCGVAQAIIMWFQLAIIIVVVTRKQFDITQWRSRFVLPKWRLIKPLLVLGLPIGAMMFAEMGLFSFTTLLLGRFGSDVVASHNIAMNINGVMFMPPMALGMAATIRIGFRIGTGEAVEARTTAIITVVLTLLFALAGALLIVLFRAQMVALYTSEPVVSQLSMTLLLFVVFFLAFDALQSTVTGCLRGYKDTRVPMGIAMFSYWVIGLPLECVLGFGLVGEPMGVYGFWLGLAVGIGIAAMLLLSRLWFVSRNPARRAQGRV
jgi:multidrug resistance protein, MATE family